MDVFNHKCPILESINHHLNRFGRILQHHTPQLHAHYKCKILNYIALFETLKNASSPDSTNPYWSGPNYKLPVASYIHDPKKILNPLI